MQWSTNVSISLNKSVARCDKCFEELNISVDGREYGHTDDCGHVHRFIPCDDLPAVCLCGKLDTKNYNKNMSDKWFDKFVEEAKKKFVLSSDRIDTPWEMFEPWFREKLEEINREVHKKVREEFKMFYDEI